MQLCSHDFFLKYALTNPTIAMLRATTATTLFNGTLTVMCLLSKATSRPANYSYCYYLPVLWQVMIALYSSTVGPMVGIFFLGGISKHANWKVSIFIIILRLFGTGVDSIFSFKDYIY